MGALLLAWVLLLGVVRSGAHYMYCPGMQRVAPTSCCAKHGPAADDHASTPQVRSQDCCRELTLDNLPPANDATRPCTVAPPAETHALPQPLPSTRASWLGSAVHRSHYASRAGPRIKARQRAELMVAQI
jgi:hypothetical protein